MIFLKLRVAAPENAPVSYFGTLSYGYTPDTWKDWAVSKDKPVKNAYSAFIAFAKPMLMLIHSTSLLHQEQKQHLSY